VWNRENFPECSLEHRVFTLLILGGRFGVTRHKHWTETSAAQWCAKIKLFEFQLVNWLA
jgi:hypothetical protein